MASITLEGGIEVDLATKEDFDQLQQQILLPEIMRPLSGNVTVPTSGSTILVFPQRPSKAVDWDLRTLCVVGADDHTAVANVQCALYIASDVTTIDLQQVFWPLITVPSADRWKDQLRIPGGEALFLVFSGSGLSSGQVYTANGWVGERQHGIPAK